MSFSLDRILWQQRAIQRLLDQINPQMSVIRLTTPHVADQLEQLARLNKRIAMPLPYVKVSQDVERALAAQSTFASFKRLTALNHSVVQQFQDNQKRIEQLLQSFRGVTFQIPKWKDDVLASLIPVESLLRLKPLSESLVKRALQPQLAFQKFAEGQLKIAASSSAVPGGHILEAVDASTLLLEPMTLGFEVAALLDPDSGWEPETTEASADISVFDEIGQDLEDLDLDHPDLPIRQKIEDGRPAHVAELGADLVQIIYDLNQDAERTGQEPVFKPTSKTMMACCVIPCRVAIDSTSFHEVVDSLFFLLYEGSGNGRRLTDRYDEQHLDALWLLKHLRLGARHDVDHGSATESSKKSVKIGDAFEELIGASVARTREDWARAQIALYQRLQGMLVSLWDG